MAKAMASIKQPRPLRKGSANARRCKHEHPRRVHWHASNCPVVDSSIPHWPRRRDKDMTALAQAAGRVVEPLEVFEARCEARAMLFERGELDLIDAVDGLQAAAV